MPTNQQLNQLLCSCDDPRIIIQDFGPRRTEICCIGVDCEEPAMLWFDTRQAAIDAWKRKHGEREDGIVTFVNGSRFVAGLMVRDSRGKKVKV